MAASLDDRAHPIGNVTGPIAEEIVRLELLRRLSMGVAHTLNNAFTAILGETLCLLEERKEDALVIEACSLIQQEAERCAKLTRSLAMRVQRRNAVTDESDLAALLRNIEPTLRETVSRAIGLYCEPPPPGFCVLGGSEDLEMLVLSTALRLVRASSAGGELRIRVEGEDEGPEIDLVFQLRVDATAARERESLDPAWEGLVDRATHSIAARCSVALLDEGLYAKRLRLTRVAAD